MSNTRLDDLLDSWAEQRHAALASLPTKTRAQRTAYWKASKRARRKIEGRAGRVAFKLQSISWLVIYNRDFRPYPSAYNCAGTPTGRVVGATK